jgi:Tfp pilus assembly protein PilO
MPLKITLTLAFCILITGLWIAPQWKKSNAQSTQIQTLETEKNQLHQELQKISAKANADSVDLEVALSQIPNRKAQAELIRDLINLSNKSGFVFKTLGFSVGANPEVGAQELSVRFSLLGRESGLETFLLGVEQNQRWLGLRNFNFQKTERAGTPLVQMEMDLYSFYQDTNPSDK